VWGGSVEGGAIGLVVDPNNRAAGNCFVWLTASDWGSCKSARCTAGPVVRYNSDDNNNYDICMYSAI